MHNDSQWLNESKQFQVCSVYLIHPVISFSGLVFARVVSIIIT